MATPLIEETRTARSHTADRRTAPRVGMRQRERTPDNKSIAEGNSISRTPEEEAESLDLFATYSRYTDVGKRPTRVGQVRDTVSENSFRALPDEIREVLTNLGTAFSARRRALRFVNGRGRQGTEQSMYTNTSQTTCA